MLIPSIDLMGGKIVQLIQGDRKALEFSDFEDWIARFCRFPCQVGGGIRSVEAAENMLAAGARRVILGSSLIRYGRPNIAFAEQAARSLGPESFVFAVDSKGGRVAIRGWREQTALTPLEMIQRLDPWCAAFLYTHIDTEGLMQGIPLAAIQPLRAATRKQLIAAGGISTIQQIEELDAQGIDAVVGMAIYTGGIDLSSPRLSPPSRR